MKYGFFKSVSFKLIMLLVTIVFTLVTASFMFNKQIDMLKRQIDSIYFGNFVPLLKLNTISNSYKDLIICINNPKRQCSYLKHKREIERNWKYYFESYKTEEERVVVNAINDDIKSSFEGRNLAKFNIMIQKVNFLIDHEVKAAHSQRKEFLNQYDSMKDYLFYNIIAIVVLAFGIAGYIIFTIIKKDNQLTILNQKYKMEAITDSMTKLYNRNYFDTIFDNLPKISTANNWNSAFIMFDIDFFKQYNDTYGHDKGDETLKAVALELKNYFNKEYEYVFRLGGEEFGVILFDVNAQILEECLKDVNRNVRNLKIEHSGSKVEKVVTISIGAYLYQPSSDLSPNRMYKLADENLYKAKQNGRNQYVI